MKLSAFIFYLFLFCSAICSASIGSSDTSKVKAKPSDKKVSSYYSDPVVSMNCEKSDAINLILSEAIKVGAPTYNEGNHIGCYRIYEGAAYKILYKYGSICKEDANVLETALEKSYGNYNAIEKAWIMRMAFDQILGVPTTTK